MREETMIEAINDIDSIRCMVEDIHEEITNTPDYWTRLEHQYAGMAMQGMLSNPAFWKMDWSNNDTLYVDLITMRARSHAHALVQKMKEERK